MKMCNVESEMVLRLVSGSLGWMYVVLNHIISYVTLPFFPAPFFQLVYGTFRKLVMQKKLLVHCTLNSLKTTGEKKRMHDITGPKCK